MIYPIALASLGLGAVAGWSLASRFMLRTLVVVILALICLVVWVSLSPAGNLPGDGVATVVAAYLVAPPLASGLFGGALFRWLLRRQMKPS